MRKHGNKELMVYTDCGFAARVGYITDKEIIKSHRRSNIKTALTVMMYVLAFMFLLWVFLSSVEISLNSLDPDYVYHSWNIFKLIT